MRGRHLPIGPRAKLGLPSFRSSPTPNNKFPSTTKDLLESSSTHSTQLNQQRSTMAGRRIAYVAVPVAAVGGYYFYAAGGDSKVAQKKAERSCIGAHNNQSNCQAYTN